MKQTHRTGTPVSENAMWQRIKRRIQALRAPAPVVPSWKQAPCFECGVPAGRACLATCWLGTHCDCPTHKPLAVPER